MKHVEVKHRENLATVTLARGKVNPLNGKVIEELGEVFRELAQDEQVEGVILTGRGPFFSFGFDVPELLDWPPEDFSEFLLRFNSFLADLYVFPKPLVAAVNGHAPAGGCMLCLAADQRIMVKERASIGLNEASFGATLFAGAVELLRRVVGDPAATRMTLAGDLLSPDEALRVGLVDALVVPEQLMAEAETRVRSLWHGHAATFRSLKSLLRAPTAEFMLATAADSVEDFVRIWYSESTREELAKIEIR